TSKNIEGKAQLEEITDDTTLNNTGLVSQKIEIHGQTYFNRHSNRNSNRFKKTELNPKHLTRSTIYCVFLQEIK
ncbi:24577_t:CDS:1, partial [Gigaspora rosea]